MGMFDYINYTMKCPVCGNIVDDFQSKDGECIMAVLEVGAVDNFYSSCPKCNTQIKFQLKRSDFNITIDNFIMKIQKAK